MSAKEIAIKFINNHHVPSTDEEWDKFISDYQWYILKFPDSEYIETLNKYLCIMLELGE